MKNQAKNRKNAKKEEKREFIFAKLQELRQRDNLLSHNFEFDKENGIIKENIRFGFEQLQLKGFTEKMLPVIDAWHHIEHTLIMLKKADKLYIFATSFILNEMLIEDFELNEANILKLLAEFNKDPMKFYLLDYLRDLEPELIEKQAGKFEELGQRFADFTRAEQKKGKLFEIKAPYDRSFVPAMVVSRNDYYDLILTRTRYGYGLGIFPMLAANEQREFNPKNWDKKLIDEMKKAAEDFTADAKSRKMKVEERLTKIYAKAKEQAEKTEKYALALSKKIEHLKTAKTPEALKEAYKEARKTKIGGSITKGQMIELNKIYKEHLKALEKTASESKKAENKEKQEKKAESKKASAKKTTAKKTTAKSE